MTSVGCRSGVHWMRVDVAPSIEPAIARASTVFAVPGTSSSSTCPPHIERGDDELDLLALAVHDGLDVVEEALRDLRRGCERISGHYDLREEGTETWSLCIGDLALPCAIWIAYRFYAG